MMKQFVTLFLRFIAAIVVSCLVSYVVFFGGMFLLMWAGMLGIVLLYAITGFCGVFVGALCLPRSTRRFGSAVLLALGLAYYAYCLVSLDIVRAENNGFPFVWLIPLAGGGVISLIVIWRRSPNQTLQATAAVPGS